METVSNFKTFAGQNKPSAQLSKVNTIYSSEVLSDEEIKVKEEWEKEKEENDTTPVTGIGDDKPALEGMKFILSFDKFKQ